MVILNLLGKIEPICISQKLKLYISNLPKDEDNDWNSHLIEEMEIALKCSAVKSEMYEAHYGKSIFKDIKSILKTKYPNLCVEKMSERACIQYIADEMICLYFDYDYDDMPVGDWTSNCFDGRLCEGDYAEKISYFIHLMCQKQGRTALEHIEKGGFIYEEKSIIINTCCNYAGKCTDRLWRF